jgi:hypothetical protein
MIAHWIPTDLSVSVSENDIVQSTVTDFVATMYYYDLARPDAPTGPAIKIEADWLDYMLPNMNITGDGGTVEATPLQLLFQLLLQDSAVLEDGTKVPAFAAADDQNSGDHEHVNTNLRKALLHVQKVFAAVVTEALARVASREHTYMLRSFNDTAVVATNIGTQTNAQTETFTWSDGKMSLVSDTPELANSSLLHFRSGEFRTAQEFVDALSTLPQMRFEAERYGYGSGKVGPTLTFALAVIYTYLSMVGAYFLYVTVLARWLWCSRSDVATITAWGDVAELLLLGWNSKPSPDLSRSSVKVRGSTWRTEVGIRAEASGRAELVTSEEGVEMLRRNELYH